MLPDIRPGNTKILYFFNCLLDGMHTKITYICDFSRCGLNTRLYTLVSKLCSKATNIGYFIYCERLFACGKSELLFYFHFTEAQCQILLLYVIMTQL